VEEEGAMAFNCFVNFGDIKGESTDKDHKDWVMALGYSHAVTHPAAQTAAGGGSVEAGVHSEFVITKLVDSATPKLCEAACKGTHIPEVTVELWRAAREKPVRYMEFKMKEVLITGVIEDGDSTGAAQSPTETVKWVYGAIEWTYTKLTPDGSAAGNVSANCSVVQGTHA
jgi:type VI secretion system secreted protein Hcp